MGKSNMKKFLKHKYHAKPTEVDNIKFSSKLEARYYGQLKLLQQAGEILFFLRQTPLHLPGNIRYVVDFVEFWAPKNEDQGDVIFTECKGCMTPQGKDKIKMAEDIYGISINIVNKA